MLRRVNFTAAVILLSAFYGLAYSQADPWLVTVSVSGVMSGVKSFVDNQSSDLVETPAK